MDGPLSLATDVTLGASGHWLGTRTGAGGTATLTESFFWPQPMAPWTTGLHTFWNYLRFFQRKKLRLEDWSLYIYRIYSPHIAQVYLLPDFMS